MKEYSFSAVIQQNEDMDAAYIIVPIDIRAEFGKGRLKVHAQIDGTPYDGSIVNMGLKDSGGAICYLLGIPKAIRSRIGKSFGDEITVRFTERI